MNVVNPCSPLVSHAILKGVACKTTSPSRFVGMAIMIRFKLYQMRLDTHHQTDVIKTSHAPTCNVLNMQQLVIRINRGLAKDPIGKELGKP